MHLTTSHAWTRWLWMGGLALLLAGCTTPAVSPTGLAGGQVTCNDGPRQVLDCRGALRQFARDFKVDLSLASQLPSMPQGQVGVGTASTKLTEADALTSD